MISIKFNKRESQKAIQLLKNSQRILDQAINKALNKLGSQIQSKARELAPVKRGQLRRSITKRMGNRYVVIGTDLKYARIHEFGGIITPKAKKTLAFKVNGKWVFAKKVKIPKYKGRGYFTPAFQKAKKDAKRIFKKEIQINLK